LSERTLKSAAKQNDKRAELKVDLIMWTHNSEKNLPAVLKRIEEVIPPQNISRKIISDDHSKDRTREIAKDFGWEVHINKGRGLKDNKRLKAPTRDPLNQKRKSGKLAVAMDIRGCYV